jgi:hypothetical protein
MVVDYNVLIRMVVVNAWATFLSTTSLVDLLPLEIGARAVAFRQLVGYW